MAKGMTESSDIGVFPWCKSAGFLSFKARTKSPACFIFSSAGVDNVGGWIDSGKTSISKRAVQAST